MIVHMFSSISSNTKVNCQESNVMFTLSDKWHSKWMWQHDSHITVRVYNKATWPTSQHQSHLYTNTSCNYHRRRGTTIFPCCEMGFKSARPN